MTFNTKFNTKLIVVYHKLTGQEPKHVVLKTDTGDELWDWLLKHAQVDKAKQPAICTMIFKVTSTETVRGIKSN